MNWPAGTAVDRERAELEAAIQASMQAATPASGDRTYEARFVTHLTLDSAGPITPGASVVKRWRMRNDGRHAWPVGTRLANVGAELLGAPAEGLPVPPVAPGDTIDIELRLVAPPSAGRHVGYWRLVTPDGVRFGHRIWADLFVETAPTPLPTTDAAIATALPAAPTTAPAPAPVSALAPAPAALLPAAPLHTPESAGVLVAAAGAAEPLDRTSSATGRRGAPCDGVPAGEGDLGEDILEGARRWSSQLLVLGEMGLHDIAANVVALDAMDGDVARAVNRLFGIA